MADRTPHIEYDIAVELDSLQREPGWEAGHTARTLVKYDNLRVVLIAVKARNRIPAHQTEGRITIHTIRGHLRVHAAGRTFDVPANRLLALDHDLRHDVEALEDSGFLLSIAWPGGNSD